jgi:Multiubiquitin
MVPSNDNPGHGGGADNPGGNQGGGPQHDQVTIVVNGRAKKWTKERISYDELVQLSGLPLPSGPNPGFTITYHNGPDHQDGTVVPGQSVNVRDGMVFNVTPTNQS